MPAPRTLALPMYDLPEVRADTDELGRALRRRLEDAGVGGIADALDRPSDLHRSWRAPELLLSQACGYPLVAALPRVAVVGVFGSPDAGTDRPGWYRSVIVGSAGGRRRAVNDRWSLSGWISLLAVDADDAADRSTVITGSHRASLEAVRSGAADVASIDAVTFALIAEHAPADVDGVSVVGRGPEVPALPLITARAELVPVLRRALAEVVDDPRLAGIRRRLHIDRFVPLDRAAYAGVGTLARSVIDADPTWP